MGLFRRIKAPHKYYDMPTNMHSLSLGLHAARQCCAFTVGLYEALYCCSHVCNVCSLRRLCTWKWDRSFCLWFVSPLSHTVTQQTKRTHRFILNNQEKHTWSYLHIHPQRINSFQEHKSEAILLRVRDSWQALHRIPTMNYAKTHKHQGYSWVSTD